MSKIVFLGIFLINLLFLIGAGCDKENKQQKNRISAKTEKEIVIAKAKELFKQKLKEGLDMSNGPCLGEIPDVSGWVVDVAHFPRQAIDNKPENQCQTYREGKAKHFVELDENGNLIKVQ